MVLSRSPVLPGPHTVGTLFLFVNLVFAVAWERAPLAAKRASINTYPAPVAH
jgi:hypothetical protein